jgi:tRNA threonylcarbamoyladenosine biosynthesis protein TsaB
MNPAELHAPSLAIDTSTPTGSVAVGSSAVLLAQAVVGVNARHAEALLPVIDFVLERAGVTPAQLGAIIVAGGPGSFTGVRIAAAAAKGFARALQLPLYSYSGLLAGAAAAGAADRPVCTLFDARRGEVYAACYSFAQYERVEEHLAPCAATVEAVLERVAQVRPLFVGEGAQRYAEQIRAAGGQIVPSHVDAGRAGALLWLHAIDPARGLVREPASWEPDYLRAWGAERSPAK